MSSATISSLPRLSREALASRIASRNVSGLAVIDVRGSDFIGGHIVGCLNIPASDLDWKTPELVRTLKDKDTVVFHCALSQQRGPSAALKYLRERERMAPAEDAAKLAEEDKQASKELVGRSHGQEVYVLDGGFVKWQEKYGEDKTLTEGYQKDIWEFGY